MMSIFSIKIIQPFFSLAHAYEISAIPFTTFIRFFEWFREISDIENAQSAQLIQNLTYIIKA